MGLNSPQGLAVDATGDLYIADFGNDRVVEVSYGGDTLKLERATREQQEKIIDGWLARHPAGS